MRIKLFLSLILLSILLASCSSNNSPYKPTTYQSYSVTPYEDEFVKIENTSTDFRNWTQEKDTSTDSVRLTLKKSNTIIKVRKIKDGRKPSFQGNYEIYVNNSDTKHSSSILGDECGKFIAYVPSRGIVCWNDGNEQGGNNGKLVIDEKSGKVNIHYMTPWVQIYRSNGEQDLVAQKTLLVEIKRAPDIEKNKGALWYKGDAHLYSKGQNKETASFYNLYDFFQVRHGGGSPNFMRASDDHIQLGQLQNNSLLEVVTFNQDLSQKSLSKDVFIARQASENPTDLDFHTYSYKHWLDNVDYKIVGKNLSRNIPSRLSYSFLKTHPTQKNWFVFLGPDGEESLPDNAVGMIPLLVQENYQPKSGGTRAVIESGAFQSVHGWIIAYLDNNNKVVYGWGSPELSWTSGPIWKDLYLHERNCTLGQIYKTKFSVTSTGCYVRQYLSIYLGQDSTTDINQYSEADDGVEFVHGPFIVAQNMDETWQVYTQQSYLFDSGQTNLATYNRPNNFSGSLPKAKTGKEAIAQAEKWLENYVAGIEKRLQERHQTLLAHFDVVEKRNRDERMRATIAKHKAEQKERARLRMEAEYRQDAIRSAQRANARATAMKAVESGSFTNRLRNMSGAGSSSRAINSLESMTNRLRQAQGKGYQSR
jgi:hypothetical protein